jgi:hypothetical protein
MNEGLIFIIVFPSSVHISTCATAVEIGLRLVKNASNTDRGKYTSAEQFEGKLSNIFSMNSFHKCMLMINHGYEADSSVLLRS